MTASPTARASFAALLLAGAVTAPVLSAPSPARAAPGDGREVVLSDGAVFSTTLVQDGSGHGTKNACFINTKNGFTGPVDDSPQDGNVCTNDVFYYNINYAFPASPTPKTYRITVGLTTDPVFNTFAVASNVADSMNFCSNDPAGNFTAKLDGSYSCLITTKANTSFAGAFRTGQQMGFRAPWSSYTPPIQVSVDGSANTVIPGPTMQVLSAPTLDAKVRWKNKPGEATVLNGKKYVKFNVELALEQFRQGQYDTNLLGNPEKGIMTALNIENITMDFSALPTGTIYQNVPADLTQQGTTFTYRKMNSKFVESPSFSVLVPLESIPTKMEWHVPITQFQVSTINNPYPLNAYSKLQNPNFVEPGFGLSRTTSSYVAPYETTGQRPQMGDTNPNNNWMTLSYDPQVTPNSLFEAMTVYDKKGVPDIYSVSGIIQTGTPVWRDLKVKSSFTESNQVMLCDQYLNKSSQTGIKGAQIWDTTRQPIVWAWDETGKKVLLTQGTDYRIEFTKSPDQCVAPTQQAVWTSDPTDSQGMRIVLTNPSQGPLSFYSSNKYRWHADVPFKLLQLNEYPTMTYSYLDIPNRSVLSFPDPQGTILSSTPIDGLMRISKPSYNAYNCTRITPLSNTGCGGTDNILTTVNAGGEYGISFSGTGTSSSVPAADKKGTFTSETTVSSCALNLTKRDLVATELNSIQETITPPDLGPDGIACTSDDVSGWKITLTGNIDGLTTYSSGQWRGTFTVAPWANPNTIITLKTTSGLRAPDGTALSQSTTQSPATVAAPSTVGQSLTSPTPTRISRGTDITWNAVYFNNMSARVSSKFLTIFPYKGDGRGTTMDTANTPITINASGLSYNAKVYVTTMDPRTINPANQNPRSTGTWCELGTTGCPSTGNYTAYLLEGDILGSGTQRINVSWTMSTKNASMGDVIGQNLSEGYISTTSQTIPVSSTITHTIYANSISGTAYIDVDNDNKRTAADKVLPNHSVELLRNGAVIATTTTDAQGNYSFTNLEDGNYQVRQGDLDTKKYSGYSQAGSTTGRLTPVLTLQDTRADNVDLGVLALPQVSLTKSADKTTLTTGEKITYTIKAMNTGDARLRVTLADPGCTNLQGPAANSFLAPQQEATYTCTYTATERDQQAGSYTNTATLTAEDDQPTTPTLTRTAQASSTVVAPPAVSIVKTANVPEGKILSVGTPVTWSYKVTNSGGVTLTNYTITDDKLGTVCSLTNLAPGQSNTCTKQGTIN